MVLLQTSFHGMAKPAEILEVSETSSLALVLVWGKIVVMLAEFRGSVHMCFVSFWLSQIWHIQVTTRFEDNSLFETFSKQFLKWDKVSQIKMFH